MKGCGLRMEAERGEWIKVFACVLFLVSVSVYDIRACFSSYGPGEIKYLSE